MRVIVWKGYGETDLFVYSENNKQFMQSAIDVMKYHNVDPQCYGSFENIVGWFFRNQGCDDIEQFEIKELI